MQAVEDMFWVRHGISPVEADRLPLLRKAKLRKMLNLRDEVAADHSPAKQAEDAARLADAKRKAGQL